MAYRPGHLIAFLPILLSNLICAQSGSSTRFYSFVSDQDISILQEKMITEHLVGIDPETLLFVDEARRDLAVRCKLIEDPKTIIEAGATLGFSLRRNRAHDLVMEPISDK